VLSEAEKFHAKCAKHFHAEDAKEKAVKNSCICKTIFILLVTGSNCSACFDHGHDPVRKPAGRLSYTFSPRKMDLTDEVDNI